MTTRARGEGNKPAIGNTSKGIIPRQKRRQHSKPAASHVEHVRRVHGAGRRCVRAAGQHQEAQVECEEEHEEHDGRAQRAEEENGREDEPARQEKGERRLRHGRVFVWAALADDVPVGREEDAVGDPEAAVRGEGGGTKGVADGHFPVVLLAMLVWWRSRDENLPHAGKELDETTIAKSQGDDNVGHGDAACVEVDGREHKRGEGEGAEAERRRVGKLARLDRAIETGLELTAEGGQASIGAGVDVGHGVVVFVVAVGAGVGVAVGAAAVDAGARGLVAQLMVDSDGLDLVGHCCGGLNPSGRVGVGVEVWLSTLGLGGGGCRDHGDGGG